MSIRMTSGLIAVVAALAATAPAEAQKRLADPNNVFAYVVGDGWALDPDGDGLAIQCDGEECGETGAWCETAVSGEVPEAAVQDFLKGSDKDVDSKVVSSAGADAKYVAVTPMARKTVGGKDGFYGEYDLIVKGETPLKSVVLHTYNKRRLLIVTCFSDAQRLPAIREIVEKSETPS